MSVLVLLQTTPSLFATPLNYTDWTVDTQAPGGKLFHCTLFFEEGYCKTLAEDNRRVLSVKYIWQMSVPNVCYCMSAFTSHVIHFKLQHFLFWITLIFVNCSPSICVVASCIHNIALQYRYTICVQISSEFDLLLPLTLVLRALHLNHHQMHDDLSYLSCNLLH